MKNKESTTALHHNVLSDQREAIRLTMYIGNTIELGGETLEVSNERKKGLIDEISQSCDILTAPKNIESIITHFKQNWEESVSEFHNNTHKYSFDAQFSFT